MDSEQTGGVQQMHVVLLFRNINICATATASYPRLTIVIISDIIMF